MRLDDRVQIDSPMPMPCGLAVIKRWNKRSVMSDQSTKSCHYPDASREA
jgi:hypothetical protein